MAYNAERTIQDPSFGGFLPCSLNMTPGVLIIDDSSSDRTFAARTGCTFTLHFLAALFAYRFCRYLALPILPSLLGAVAFSCTGFLGSAAWLDISSAVALTPLIFYFAFRLWTEDGILKNAAPLGLVLGLSWWTGHHEIPMILCYAVLFGSVCVAASGRSWRVIKGTLLAFALAIPISAIQTLPFYEFGHASRRWVGMANPIGWADKVPYEVHARYSLPWLGLANSSHPEALPRIIGPRSPASPSWFWRSRR